jgi:hypothetical protein
MDSIFKKVWQTQFQKNYLLQKAAVRKVRLRSVIRNP